MQYQLKVNFNDNFEFHFILLLFDSYFITFYKTLLPLYTFVLKFLIYFSFPNSSLALRNFYPRTRTYTHTHTHTHTFSSTMLLG